MKLRNVWPALGLAVALSAPALAPVAAAPLGPRTPHASIPPDRFSVDALDVITPAQAQAMHQAGVQLVRYYFSWIQVQPTESSPYDWRHDDATLTTLADAHLDVQVLLTANPSWAASQGNGPVDRVPVQRYYDFVAAAAARYGGPAYTVRSWEIYNEPDTVDNWGMMAAEYAQVLAQDRQIITSASPDAAVIMGGMGYDFFTDEGGAFVRSFLPDFLAAGGGPFTDAINFHHYPASPAWPTLGAAVDSIRQTLASAGVQKPLIWTETGAPSDPNYGGSLAAQADYVVEAYTAGLMQGLQTVTWFPLHDFNDPNHGSFASDGLLAADNSPKPAYTAYTVAAGYLTTATPLRPLTAAELGGSTDASGYAFARPDGTGIVVAWTPSGTASTTWPATAVSSVVDVYGQAIGYTVHDGVVDVPLGADPVYVILDAPPRFVDVPLDSWFEPFVELLVERGAISGYADATFRPFNSTTRAQISKMIVLALGWPIDTSGGQVFADVPADNPYYGVIETAAAHGIISGYSCGGPGEPCDTQNRPYFRPNASVTRGQLSKMLTLARGWTPVAPDGGPQDFSDVPRSYPLYGYVEAVFQHGVVSGYGDGTFRPGNNATRAQLAKMIETAINAP